MISFCKYLFIYPFIYLKAFNQGDNLSEEMRICFFPFFSFLSTSFSFFAQQFKPTFVILSNCKMFYSLLEKL